MACTACADILVDKCRTCLGSDAQAFHQLNCIRCKQAVHLDCMRREFKDAGNSALKNNSEWLGEFIRFSSLQFLCGKCASGVIMTNHDIQCFVQQSR